MNFPPEIPGSGGNLLWGSKAVQVRSQEERLGRTRKFHGDDF